MSRLDLTQPDDLGAFIGKTLASFVSGNNQPDMSGDDRNRIRHPHIRERYDRSCIKLATEILAAVCTDKQPGIAAGDEPKDRAMIAATQQPAGEGELWPVGSWLSAALDDPKVCAEMKRDIREWFDGNGHIRAALSATQQPVSEGVGWRPIETAPKDGSRIIGLTKFGVEVVKWHEWDGAEYGPRTGWIGVEQDSTCYPASYLRAVATYQPTLWQPLAPAPNPIGEEKGAES